MIKCIILRCGYVESSQTSIIIFSSEDSFETPKEAIISLATGLYHKYTEEFYDTRQKSCCKIILKKDKTANFCSKCGRDLKEEFDVEKYLDWLRNFGKLTADDIGMEEISNGKDGYWDTWANIEYLRSLEDNEIVEISSCGESIMLDAISALLPENTNLTEIGFILEEYKKLYTDLGHTEKAVDR